MNTLTHTDARQQKVGGAAAIYLALAYIAAMPYFLLLVDYPSATTAADKVALIIGNYSSMYAMYIATYVLFGFALVVLVLALYDRLRDVAPFASRIAAVAGLIWSFALVASGMVYTYGMTAIVELAKANPAQAATLWRAMEPVALGLGGAGGEILGGLWVLMVSWLALRSRALPRMLGWLGVLIGVAGLASVAPPLHDVAYLFGLLQIVWFIGVGTSLLRTKGAATEAMSQAPANATQPEPHGAVLRPATPADPHLA